MSESEKCETSRRVVLKGFSYDRGYWLLYQPTCKTWGCKPCAEALRSQWALRIKDGVGVYRDRGLEGWRFVTITSSPKNKTMDQCLHVWPLAWAKLSARLRRYRPGIRYCLIPELHKNFRVHAHIIVSGAITHRWLKDQSAKSGFGWRCAVDPLGEFAAYYVVKYLTKSLDFPEWPKNFRRIRTSQKWPVLVDLPEFEAEEIAWEYYCMYEAHHLSGLAAMCEYDWDKQVEVIGEVI